MSTKQFEAADTLRQSVMLSLEPSDLLISDVFFYHRMALLLSLNSSWLSSGYFVAVWYVTVKMILPCLLDVTSIPEAVKVLYTTAQQCLSEIT